VKTSIIRFAANGRVTIPAWLRRQCGIRGRLPAKVHVEGDRIILTPLLPLRRKSLRGSLKGTGVLQALVEDRQAEQRREDLRRSPVGTRGPRVRRLGCLETLRG
jgi:bifunctional DNA-binding transcriptional regulator/antitoxin component of YhaV-PrlF toxin-antitoxin module